MERNRTIETEAGRFDVVFKQLEELQKGEDLGDSEAAQADSEAIDELRRLSAELAEPPTTFYTYT